MDLGLDLAFFLSVFQPYVNLGLQLEGYLFGFAPLRVEHHNACAPRSLMLLQATIGLPLECSCNLLFVGIRRDPHA